ncbi:S8/S53 family peptidase [Deinococcus arcticus]|uniref:S8/S53 family peptidase n=1 Tax=Deinococcus arcticus TaxID=2136176 RepID=UPI001305039D|nr:S8/S53 family peptidase [Deinococcus arcticus]
MLPQKASVILSAGGVVLGAQSLPTGRLPLAAVSALPQSTPVLVKAFPTGGGVPPGLSSAQWRNTRDYIRRQGLVLTPSDIQNGLLRPGLLNPAQLQGLRDKQGGAARPLIVPFNLPQKNLVLLDPLPLGRLPGIFDFKQARAAFGDLPPEQLQRGLQLLRELPVRQYGIDQVPSEDGGVCADGGLLTSLAHVQRQLGGAVARALLEQTIGFDPNTDPWVAATGTVTIGASGVQALGAVSSPQAEVDAVVLDTWDFGKADSYKTPVGAGHGQVIARIIKARAGMKDGSASTEGLRAFSVCANEQECQSGTTIRVIAQLCQAIAQHQQRQQPGGLPKLTVVNLSFSQPVSSPLLQKVIALALRNGMFVLASHGNSTACKDHRSGDQCNAYPADFQFSADLEGRFWRVSAQLNAGQPGRAAEISRAAFMQRPDYNQSDFHKRVNVPVPPDLFAPYSFWFRQPDRPAPSGHVPNRPAPFTGTSFATAYASGTLSWWLTRCGRPPQNAVLQALIHSQLAPKC